MKIPKATGLKPTGMVAITAFDPVLMTDTVLDSVFVMYALYARLCPLPSRPARAKAATRAARKCEALWHPSQRR
jgi:hypothetical protein